jgi:hypothetical protein
MYTRKAICLGSILFCLVMVISLVSYNPVEASHVDAVPSGIPYLFLPIGTTYTKTPTFSFDTVIGATYYRLNVYRRSDNQRVIRDLDINATTACLSSYCQYTPSVYEHNMQYGVEYKYKIVGGNASGLGTYSNLQYFTPQPGFNSTFSSNASGWMPKTGTWTVRPDGTYRGVGVAGQFFSVRHEGNYDNFTFEAKIRRNDFSGNGYGLIFRGDTSVFKVDKMWNSGYLFLISGDNDFLISRTNPGGYTDMLGWFKFDGIDGTTWNTLKVSANGGRLKFYINGKPVAQLYDTTYSSGAVGLIAYDDVAGFYVDDVKLTMAQPSFYFRAPILQPEDCPPDPRGCFSFK